MYILDLVTYVCHNEQQPLRPDAKPPPRAPSIAVIAFLLFNSDHFLTSKTSAELKYVSKHLTRPDDEPRHHEETSVRGMPRQPGGGVEWVFLSLGPLRGNVCSLV